MSETNEQPTEDQKPLDAIWDIDEVSFDESFGLTTGDADPILGNLKIEEPIVEKKEEAEEVKADTEVDIETLVEAKEEPKKETPEVEFNEEAIGEQVKEEETEEGDPLTLFAEELAKQDIIEIDDDFEPTEKGLLSAVNGTVEKRVQDEIDYFQKSLPEDGKALLRHLMDGGQVNTFLETFSTPDISQMEVRGENGTNQKYVLKEFMRLRGDSQEDITEALDMYEDNGVLERQANKAKDRLLKYYNQQKDQLELRRNQEKEAKEIQRREVIENISSKINDSEAVKGFPITTKNKKQLVDYMTVPNVKVDNEDGTHQYVTQFQADEMHSSQDIDDFILKAYLRMTNYDLEGLKKKAVSNFSKKFKKSLQSKKELTDTPGLFGGDKRPNMATGKGAEWSI